MPNYTKEVEGEDFVWETDSQGDKYKVYLYKGIKLDTADKYKKYMPLYQKEKDAKLKKEIESNSIDVKQEKIETLDDFINQRNKEASQSGKGLYGEEGKDWYWDTEDGKHVRKVVGYEDGSHWSEREFEKNEVEGIDYLNKTDDYGNHFKSLIDSTRSEFNKKIRTSMANYEKKYEAEQSEEKKKKAFENKRKAKRIF